MCCLFTQGREDGLGQSSDANRSVPKVIYIISNNYYYYISLEFLPSALWSGHAASLPQV